MNGIQRLNLLTVGRAIASLAGVLVLAAVLAACAPSTAPEPELPEVGETEASATPEVATPSPDEITASFEIPVGLSDQELAEAYVDRVDRWWNYGATTAFATDESRYEVTLTEYADNEAKDNAAPIAEGLYADENTEGLNTNTVINGNTLAQYIQTHDKGSPFEHNLELVSLESTGHDGSIYVMRITVSETSTEPSDELNQKSPYQLEVRFVVDGNSMKVASDRHRQPPE